jgi:hypothetical protein
VKTNATRERAFRGEHPQKAAACFARRVKGAAQKYISFRKSVFVI